MATRAAIEKLKTKWNAKRVFALTPKLGKKSKAKAVSSFYGRNPILKGALHKQLGIPRTQKIPLSILKQRLATLKKKKEKTAKDVKTIRRLVFAINSRSWNK